MNAATLAAPLRLVARRRTPARLPRAITLRSATAADAAAIHELILDHLHDGHLLPRAIEEIVCRADRFVVAADGETILGCAELAPLSSAVAEVRSLVVSDRARSLGLGRRMVEELVGRAERAGFRTLCAFAHAPAYFVHLGFSIVPHVWLPEKIQTDCRTCPKFRQCGQYAVVRTLASAHDACVPLAALHG